MRTVKKIFVNRMKAQVKEAKIQGLSKIASSLDEIIDEQPVREDQASYTYSSDDFNKDVEKLLWKAAIRAADFYNCNIDAVQTQEIIESTAADFIKEMMNITGVEHGVGAYEPNIPGEVSKTVTIEIDDE